MTSVCDGYVVLGNGQREHVAIAEGVLGKPLPSKATVHHFNEDRSDNRHRNLVICQAERRIRLRARTNAVVVRVAEGDSVTLAWTCRDGSRFSQRITIPPMQTRVARLAASLPDETAVEHCQ